MEEPVPPLIPATSFDGGGTNLVQREEHPAHYSIHPSKKTSPTESCCPDSGA